SANLQSVFSFAASCRSCRTRAARLLVNRAAFLFPFSVVATVRRLKLTITQKINSHVGLIKTEKGANCACACKCSIRRFEWSSVCHAGNLAGTGSERGNLVGLSRRKIFESFAVLGGSEACACD